MCLDRRSGTSPPLLQSLTASSCYDKPTQRQVRTTSHLTGLQLVHMQQICIFCIWKQTEPREHAVSHLYVLVACSLLQGGMIWPRIAHVCTDWQASRQKGQRQTRKHV